MCGIFGFSGFEDPRLLKKMGDIIIHRGPDSEGFFTREKFSMGMRRLSIIDLEYGDQPIFNEDGTIAVCYNGEIYNFVELQDQLKHLGHQFKTHTDTEVVVHAYEEWGLDCLAHFNGMFAFSLYDISKKRLFLARDRCGQKPLYYFYQKGKLVFASEIKAILMADFISREPNIPTIDPYLTLRYVPEPQTMFKNINILPAAHYMLLENKQDLKIQRYWDIKLSEKKQYLSPNMAFQQLEHQLRKSVNLVMRSDVPVGAYLSGGIDSSLLVALISEQHSKINTYSLGFNSPHDETAEAAETAKLLGTNHSTVFCTPEDIKLLPKIIYHMDRPVGDALIIAFYKLAQLASRDLKVVISGEGADEIFAGYQFHKVMQLFQTYFNKVPTVLHKKVFLPFLNSLPASFLNKFFIFPAELGSEGKKHFIHFIQKYNENSLFKNYISLKTLWREDAKHNLYLPSLKEQFATPWIPVVRDQQGAFLDQLLKLQWDEWLQDWSIIRQDKNTMAHSLEIRLPFLDHELIELCFRTTPRQKATWFKDKIIERKLAKRLLPKEVVNRPKKPFYFPIKNFVQCKEFNELIKLTLNPQQIQKRGYFNPDYIKHLLGKLHTEEFIYLKQIVSLMILELWHMIFIDKQFS